MAHEHRMDKAPSQRLQRRPLQGRYPEDAARQKLRAICRCCFPWFDWSGETGWGRASMGAWHRTGCAHHSAGEARHVQPSLCFDGAARRRMDRKISATRQCGSKGNEDAITSGNFVCRPAGAKPVRPRVSPPEPVVSLATIPEMGSAMRRRAHMWAMGHAAPKPRVFPEAEGPGVPEGHNTPLHRCRPGEEGVVSGG